MSQRDKFFWPPIVRPHNVFFYIVGIGIFSQNLGARPKI